MGQGNVAEDAQELKKSFYYLLSLEERIVGKAFTYLREISQTLKNKYDV
jgi:hypothetical protein